MNETPEISVVMATYNGARHLREQLHTIGAQTLKPRELIIGDDRSTDETVAIAKRFATTVPFAVKVVINDRQLGYSDNFLNAVTHASGRLIAFSDQDDVWFPTKLERAAKAFRQRGVMIYSHAARLVDETLHPLGGLEPDWPRDRVYLPGELDPFSKASGFAMVADAELFKAVEWRTRPIGFNWKEDCMIPFDRWVMLFGSILGKVVVEKECLALYRRHSTNTSRLRIWRPVRNKLWAVIRRRESLVEQGLVEYMLRKLIDDSQKLVELAGFLEGVALECQGTHRDRLLTAASLYRANCHRYSDRAELYESGRTVASRALRFLRLVARGAYRNHRRFRFGYRELLRDLSVLVSDSYGGPLVKKGTN